MARHVDCELEKDADSNEEPIEYRPIYIPPYERKHSASLTVIKLQQLPYNLGTPTEEDEQKEKGAV